MPVPITEVDFHDEPKQQYYTLKGTSTVVGPHWRWFDEARTKPYYLRCYDKNGVKKGPWVTWRSDGKNWEKIYIYDNGMKNGNFKRWHPNGEPLDYGKYVDDKLDGNYYSFYDDGSPLCESVYSMGELISEECH